MAPAERRHDKSENNQNVLVRLRNLPSVSMTFEVIGKSYSSAKAANPLLSSVCGVCEEGVKSAGSLAARGVQPAVHMLQPQLIAANTLACHGLDRLEEKMLDLEYPPSKLVAGVSDLVYSAMQSPAVQYVLSSNISHLAEEGADAALTFTEQLVNYVLPVSSEEKEKKALESQTSVRATGPKPSLERLGALASTLWKRTAVQLQRTKSQGQKLAVQIPGLTSLIPGLTSKKREEILYTKGDVENAEETNGPSNGFPEVESNGVDKRNNPAYNSQEEPVKNGERVVSQPSEELHPIHTKQILETRHPEPPLES